MPQNLNTLFGSLISVLKATPSDKLRDLMDSVDHAGIQEIDDMFNEPGGEHKSPSAAQIGTGPSQSMSGSGAGKMIREYSDTARQEGLTGLYDRIDGWAADFRKAMARQQRQIAGLAGVVSDVSKSHAGMLKALEDAMAGAGQSEADAEALLFTSKANEKIVKARKAFLKAESDEDEDSREERKSKLQEVADMLKSAKQKLAKAEAEGEDDDAVEKALDTWKIVNSRVTKALAAIKAEEDKEHEEEEKKAQAAAAATTKAEEDKKREEDEAEKARQATAATAKAEEDTEEEKKDDTAKSQSDIRGMLEKALSGQATLENTVNGVMEYLQGVSRSVASPPQMATMKAAPMATIEARIDEAADAGQLSTHEANFASTLLSRTRLAEAGRYPQDRLMQDISGAPENVRSLFVAA